jgi:hypothetical protein
MVVAAYTNFHTLWQDIDPDIPVYSRPMACGRCRTAAPEALSAAETLLSGTIAE